MGLISILTNPSIFLLLYSHFKWAKNGLQMMLNVPLVLIGSVVAVMIMGSTFSVATLVSFIMLTALAS